MSLSLSLKLNLNRHTEAHQAPAAPTAPTPPPGSSPCPGTESAPEPTHPRQLHSALGRNLNLKKKNTVCVATERKEPQENQATQRPFGGCPSRPRIPGAQSPPARWGLLGCGPLTWFCGFNKGRRSCLLKNPWLLPALPWGFHGHPPAPLMLPRPPDQLMLPWPPAPLMLPRPPDPGVLWTAGLHQLHRPPDPRGCGPKHEYLVVGRGPSSQPPPPWGALPQFRHLLKGGCHDHTHSLGPFFSHCACLGSCSARDILGLIQ